MPRHRHVSHVSDPRLRSSLSPLRRLRGPYRALVVDDDALVRLMTRRTLGEAGIRHVEEAEHGCQVTATSLPRH